MPYETIIVERDGAVALVRLNRPQAMNALNVQLKRELTSALDALDADDEVAAIVITGNDKAFAAGADIKEMQDLGYTDAYMGGHFDGWDRVANCNKPVIAAVAGFALGGGCEIAMMCDFIIAADTARFGQPEIKLGMCLTGRMMNAEEAERAGLVSRVVAADKLIEEAMAAANAIAGLSRAAVRMAKECVNRAYESTLTEGLNFERKMFFSSFALADQTEGMRAFVDKRAANWKHH